MGEDRKVGSVTMGIYLVLGGLYMVLSNIFPKFVIWRIGIFAPIFLVILGIEVLYNAYVHKNDNIKFDVFSIILCFIIVVGTMGIWGFSNLVIGLYDFV
ncbi:MAG: hypothetical protein IAC55_05750 [Tyzzerella sp.]|uniref:Uncharacterized protein n=1 Tax=Candidatus Fimicola merdigallinarum TaxID=2840819 RepID=A0A9D9E0M0_9FIRM|nr:hypothetical protein [Candidatus Fimicola merdigallinarum]